MGAASALVEIVQRVDQLDIGDGAKRQIKNIVQTAAMNAGIGALDRLVRVDFAKALLDLRISRTTVKNRLVARYGISARQAYRVIDAALNCDKDRC